MRPLPPFPFLPSSAVTLRRALIAALWSAGLAGAGEAASAAHASPPPGATAGPTGQQADERRGEVSGQVLDETGDKPACAHVHLSGAAYARTCGTDAAGRFRFEGVPFGPYQLEVRPCGAFASATPVSVGSAQVTLSVRAEAERRGPGVQRLVPGLLRSAPEGIRHREDRLPPGRRSGLRGLGRVSRSRRQPGGGLLGVSAAGTRGAACAGAGFE